MTHPQPKNPMHGVTLEMILNSLVERLGWDEMGRMFDFKCFQNDPSIKSSLSFFRKNEWARKYLEEYYVKSFLPSSSDLPNPTD